MDGTMIGEPPVREAAAAMASATSENVRPKGLVELGHSPPGRFLETLGDLSLFTFRVFGLTFRGPYRGTLVPALYTVGVLSIPVVTITGMFIGMVLAVQAYAVRRVGLATRLGQIINISLVRELGPVLAAAMLAGRVGSSMAAELGTMRVTEQIDALACLGINPIRYLGCRDSWHAC